MVAAIQKAAKLESKQILPRTVLACLGLGLSLYYSGDVSGVRRPFEEGLRLTRVDQPVLRIVMLSALSLVAGDEGHMEEAESLGREARGLAFNRGQQFRDRAFQLMTAFSLPWYAVVGVQKGLDANLPWLGAIFLGMVGPTAGRYLIDITSRQPAKQFIRDEWFVTAAALTAAVYLICAHVIGLSIWPATLVAVVFGFTFRVTAVWQGWEEPMPKMPPDLMESLPEREAFKQKRQERLEGTEQ